MKLDSQEQQLRERILHRQALYNKKMEKIQHILDSREKDQERVLHSSSIILEKRLGEAAERNNDFILQKVYRTKSKLQKE